MFRWFTSKYGDLVPTAVFLTVVAGVYAYDRGHDQRPEIAQREAEALHARQASTLAQRIGTVVTARLGAMSTAELQFTQLEDTATQRRFRAAIDSVIKRHEGLLGISVIYPNGTIDRGAGARLGLGGADPLTNDAIGSAFRRAQRTGRLAASGVIPFPLGNRVFVFLPVTRRDSSNVIGFLAGEMDPVALVRTALVADQDSLAGSFWGVLGPDGERISVMSAPPEWAVVQRPVQVADTEWQVRIAYPPVPLGMFRTQRVASWVIGLGVAVGLSMLLFYLRKTVAAQQDELARRQAVEEAVRSSAAEARTRAREARDLAAQLEAAHRASERLSTSLNPDDVVETFLSGVAEILRANVASLYTFEEEGELLVGRRRMVFREVYGAMESLRSEDLSRIRTPVSLLTSITDAVATGEPHIEHVEAGANGALPAALASAGIEDGRSTLTLPLLMAGHMVGVASWEVHGSTAQFTPGSIAFARAMAAPAAAALHTAELFESLAEERARARREALRFATVLDQMADGVVVVDTEGRVERYNQAAEELLGSELEAFPLSAWPHQFNMQMADGRVLADQEVPLVRALAGARIQRATMIVRTPWNAERHLSFSAGPIVTPDGKAAGAAMVVRDVSDEHQYAEMLRHTNRELRRQAEVLERVNQQLREATKAKDQFLAVMSHELRTPINAIMGYSDLLDLGVKGDLNPDQRGMVSRVRETSRHLLGLINEVLDLAKIGAGRMDIMLVELAVADVVERAVQQILPMASAKGLSLTVAALGDESQPAHVAADETRLTQIMVNLLSNAVKFTQTGSVIVRYGVQRELVEIRVRDTGPGIPAEQRDRIFEEFYQVEGGLSRASGGTGLGLAIARRFAHLMSGDVRVESEVGVGSEFIVTLPRATPAAERSAVETMPVVLLLAGTELQGARHTADLAGAVRVISTTDPVRLPALTRAAAPNGIVLDVAASGQRAWRALSALGAGRPAGELRLGLIVQQGDAGEALDLGCCFPLFKPFMVDAACDQISAKYVRDAGPILVADADPHVRRILADALSANGHRVVQAADGGQAVERIEGEHPSVVALDLLLPGSGRGLGVLSWIRTRQPDASPRVVLMAGDLSGALLDLDGAVDAIRASNAAARPCAMLIRAAAGDRVPAGISAA